MLALRFFLAPRVLSPRQALKNLPDKEGGGAPRGASNQCRTAHPGVAARTCRGAARALRRPLAFRRSTAALAVPDASSIGSAPVPAFPETRPGGRYPLSPVSSLPSSSETGRRAGRAVAQSRPGAVCETARGHRTRSTFRIASGTCPRESELKYFLVRHAAKIHDSSSPAAIALIRRDIFLALCLIRARHTCD